MEEINKSQLSLLNTTEFKKTVLQSSAMLVSLFVLVIDSQKVTMYKENLTSFLS